MSMQMSQTSDPSAFNAWNRAGSWGEINSSAAMGGCDATSPIDIWSSNTSTSFSMTLQQSIKPGFTNSNNTLPHHPHFQQQSSLSVAPSNFGSISAIGSHAEGSKRTTTINGISSNLDALSLGSDSSSGWGSFTKNSGSGNSGMVWSNSTGQSPSSSSSESLNSPFMPSTAHSNMWSLSSTMSSGSDSIATANSFGNHSSMWMGQTPGSMDNVPSSPWSKQPTTTASLGGKSGAEGTRSDASNSWGQMKTANKSWGDAPTGPSVTTSSAQSPGWLAPKSELTSRCATPTNTQSPSRQSVSDDQSSISADIERAKNGSKEEYIHALVTTTENWGKIPVNQSTPWMLEDQQSGQGDSQTHVAAVLFQQESNVWTSEPPNGTGLWEAYYESIGQKTARWTLGNAGRASSDGSMWGEGRGMSITPTPSIPGSAIGGMWSSNSMSKTSSDAYGSGPGNMWPSGASSTSSVWGGGDREDTASVWSEAASSVRGGMNQPNQQGQNQWTGEESGMWRGGPPPNQKAAMFGAPGNDNNWMDSMGPPRRVVGGNRMTQMRVHAIKYLTNLGYKKEDAQHALITNNMDVDRALIDLQNSARSVGPPGGPQGFSNGGMTPGYPPLQSMESPGQPPSSPPGLRGLRGNSGMNAPPPSGGMIGGNAGTGPPLTPQQQMIRQQIANQLRNAVQNINPAAPPNTQANVPVRDLQTFEQLLQCQKAESVYTQRLHSLAEQIQSPSPAINPALLTQQYDSIGKQLAQIRRQIQLCSAKLNPPAGPSRPGGPQGRSFQPQQHLQQGPRLDQGPLSAGASSNDMKPWSTGMNTPGFGGDHHPMPRPGSMSDSRSGWKMEPNNEFGPPKPNYGRSISMQPGMLSSASNPMLHLQQQSGMDFMTPGGTPSSPGGGGSPPVDVKEFVPGKPWQSVSLINENDPTLTPAASRALFATVNNDRLEKLANVEAQRKFWNGMPNNGGHDFSQQSAVGRNFGMDKSAHGMGGHGGPTNGQMTFYIIVRNLDLSSAEFVKNACQNVNDSSFQPNPNAGWALIRFSSRDDALRIHTFLSNSGLLSEPLSDQDAAGYAREIAARN